MSEQENNHEYTQMSTYLRYYSDLYTLAETGDRIIALKNLTAAVGGQEIKDTDIQREVFTDDGRPSKEKLILFPITTLGPFLEQIDQSEIYANYLTAFRCINWFVGDHLEAGCNDLHRLDAACVKDEICVLKEVAKFCLDPTTGELFRSDIEYIDYASRYSAIQTRLQALRDSKLFGTMPIEQYIAHFQKDYEDYYGALPTQAKSED